MSDKKYNRICGAVCAVLMIAGLLLGSWRGWTKQYDQVLAQVAADTASVREDRAMDAANLLVVARRHLPEDDADVTALSAARETLLDDAAGRDTLTEADKAVTAAAASLAERLPALQSVKDSARDTVYVPRLCGILNVTSPLASAYEEALTALRTRMNGSLTGRLAGLLGVKP